MHPRPPSLALPTNCSPRPAPSLPAGNRAPGGLPRQIRPPATTNSGTSSPNVSQDHMSERPRSARRAGPPVLLLSQVAEHLSAAHSGCRVGPRGITQMFHQVLPVRSLSWGLDVLHPSWHHSAEDICLRHTATAEERGAGATVRQPSFSHHLFLHPPATSLIPVRPRPEGISAYDEPPLRQSIAIIAYTGVERDVPP